MRKGDEVFLFTLVDFLIQVFFFALLLFVVYLAMQKQVDEKRGVAETEQQKLLKSVGVSNLTELSDLLTKMAPLEELRGTSDFIARSGGAGKLRAVAEAASAAGGVDKISAMNEQVKALTDKVAKLEGWGKASCVPNIVVNGKAQPKSVAHVVVYDDHVEMDSPTPEMTEVLQGLGREFKDVSRLTLSEFRATFAPLVTKKPECRYFLSATTKTQFLEPMRIVWSAFRTQ
ncbi:MAG: hypothetical protein RJA34_1865 [Pseudomonadota bacterium]|jgi:hypothetical protein